MGERTWQIGNDRSCISYGTEQNRFKDGIGARIPLGILPFLDHN